MSDYLLQTRNLELAYGPFKAVAGVDLNVRAGTIHTVIGPNGAGKTSLFHCLTGERQATAGKILLNGQDIIRKPSHGRVALGMARSFQLTSLFQNLSVRENLRLAAQGRDGLGALNFWRSVEHKRSHWDTADQVLERLKLTARADTLAGELSHGQLGMQLLQRVQADAAETAKVEAYPRMEGRQMLMVLSPK